MTADKVKLKALAEAATQGEWVDDPSALGGIVRAGPVLNYSRGSGQSQIAMMTGDHWMKPGEPKANAAFIAAAGPETVLALLAEIDQQDTKGPLCFCGLKQTKNPHPEAGVPPGYLEVGTVYDCIPCLNKSRRAWSKQANKAKGELADLQAELAKRDELIAEVMAAFRLEPDGSCINPGRDFIRPFAEKVAALSADKKTGD